MCRRYRLTKHRMLEIEDYYGIDDIWELDQWQREFNIPPTEMAPIIFDHKGSRHLVQALWGLIASGTESIEEARKVSTFNARAETLMTRPTLHKCLPQTALHRPCGSLLRVGWAEGRKATAEYPAGRWEAPVNGGTVQLLDVERAASFSHCDVHGGDYDAQQVDG